MTTLPAAFINSLAVDAQNGFAYFSRNQRPTGSDIYRVPVPGDGVTPATPVLVATIPGGILNLAIDGTGTLLAGCGTDWGAGVPLYRIDVSQPSAVVTPLPLPLGNINAVAVDNVTGDMLVADSLSSRLFRVRADGSLRQFGLSSGGFVTGLAYRQPLDTYGPPPVGGAQQHIWQLGPNAGGAPATGNAQFSVTLSSSPGQSIGFVGIAIAEAAAPLQLLGMRVLVDPASMTTLPITLPGSGRTAIPLPIPANPDLVGNAVYLQSFHTGPAGWSASRGLRITLLP